MKKIILCLSGFSLTALLLSGCGQSKPDSATAEQQSASPPAAAATAVTPAAPRTASAAPAQATPTPAAEAAGAPVATTPAAQPSAPATTAASVTSPAPDSSSATPAAPAANSTDGTAMADAASQLVTAAKAQGDSTLSSVGNDLASKAKALIQSAAGNTTLKSQLTSSLKTLAGGNDSTALSSIYQTAQSASLTPPQMQLAKEVGNLASAYVVQKNFASLAGAQGDVSTIVNSLRQGQIAPAIPALQKVAQNANLTAAQKQLVASIADKYAPGISKAAGVLGQGLQSIPGLGGK